MILNENLLANSVHWVIAAKHVGNYFFLFLSTWFFIHLLSLSWQSYVKEKMYLLPKLYILNILSPQHGNATTSSEASVGTNTATAGPSKAPPAAKFRHGLLQLMIHTIDPMHDGELGMHSFAYFARTAVVGGRPEPKIWSKIS